MDAEDHDLRARLSGFLYRQYQGERESRLARDIDCDPRTAKNILNGFWPNARHWKSIVQRFGQDVLDAVFSPDIDPTLARLTEEVRQLEEQLEAKRALARQAAGYRPSPARAVPAVSDRAAEVRTFGGGEE